METLVIYGGRPLKGEVAISGAKNSALALMAGSILAQGECQLEGIPNLTDIRVISSVLRDLGVKCEHHLQRNRVLIDATYLDNYVAPYEPVTKMRASFFVLGPVLARLGCARIPLPGGCAIGSRPVDQHLKGLRALGAEIKIEHGYVECRASKLVGTSIYFDTPSVGATENVMMAAALAEGITILRNAAREPEVIDLANYLNAMGARISGVGTETITIEGVKSLHGARYHVIPDRIELGTCLVAAVITGGDLRIKNAPIEISAAVISKLQEAGVEIEIEGPTVLRVRRGRHIQPINIRTYPYPGFPTDLQAPMMVLLATIKGTSIITETVFENRFLHVDELLRMGAQVKIEGNCAVVQGVPRLSGAPVRATDLRAGAALVLAGLAADGMTIISDIHHLDRGYDNLAGKLRSLGADISRTSAPLALSV